MKPSDFNLAKRLIMWVSLPDRLRRLKKLVPPLPKPPLREEQKECVILYNILLFFSLSSSYPYVNYMCTLNE